MATYQLYQPALDSETLLGLQSAKLNRPLGAHKEEPQLLRLISGGQQVLQQGPMAQLGGGPVYLQTAAVQQQARGPQIINAFNADGQPIAIIANGGTPTVIQGSIQAQPRMQVQQVRQVGNTAFITQQGQRVVQLPNGDLQLVQQAPAPQASAPRILVQQAGAPAVRLVQNNGMQPVQQTMLRPAQPNNLAGLQLGGNIVQVANRTSNGSGNLVAFNHTSMRPGNPQVPAAPSMQLQLPSTVLVRPAVESVKQGNSIVQQATGPTAGLQMNIQPAQSLQQQAKDTLAQQRQQQLLASLRARVSTLSQGQAAAANTQAQVTNNGVIPVLLRQANGQQAQVVSMRAGENGQAQLQTNQGTMVLTAQQLQRLQAQQQVSSLDGQVSIMSLSPAQQQLLLGAKVAELNANNQLNQAVSNMYNNNGAGGAANKAIPGELLHSSAATKQQLYEMVAGKGSQDGDVASVQSLPSTRRTVASPSALLGMSLSEDMVEQVQAGAGFLDAAGVAPRMGTPDLTAAATNAQQGGKEDLRNILLSIGVELARHGIPVATAVDAGVLGVLSPADIAVLQAAYLEEERRLLDANTPPQATAANLAKAHAAAAVWAPQATELGSMMHPTSRGSPTGSAASAGVMMGGRASVDPVVAAPAPAATPALKASVGSTGGPASMDGNILHEIDDARFSAFDHSFFGPMEGSELLEPLEPNSSKRPSSADAPIRAPSWPQEQGTLNTLKASTQSVASFSELGHSMSANANRNSPAGKDACCDSASTASSSNQELATRLANLDLGCGFY